MNTLKSSQKNDSICAYGAYMYPRPFLLFVTFEGGLSSVISTDTAWQRMRRCLHVTQQAFARGNIREDAPSSTWSGSAFHLPARFGQTTSPAPGTYMQTDMMSPYTRRLDICLLVLTDGAKPGLAVALVEHHHRLVNGDISRIVWFSADMGECMWTPGIGIPASWPCSWEN